MIGGFVFENERANSEREELVHERLAIESCKNEDLRVGQISLDLPSGLDPAQAGHADIHDHDVGLQLENHFNGRSAVVGFSTNLPSPFGFDERLYSAANDIVIVREKNSGLFHSGRVG